MTGQQHETYMRIVLTHCLYRSYLNKVKPGQSSNGKTRATTARDTWSENATSSVNTNVSTSETVLSIETEHNLITRITQSAMASLRRPNEPDRDSAALEAGSNTVSAVEEDDEEVVFEPDWTISPQILPCLPPLQLS